MPATHTTIRNGKRLLWRTERLWELAAGLDPFEMDIEDIPELDRNCWFTTREATLREVANHYVRIRDADLSKPIILNADGSLMDGGHRICRLLIDGKHKIAAVRFKSMPEPDEVITLAPDA
jgi:hypothetical protein